MTRQVRGAGQGAASSPHTPKPSRFTPKPSSGGVPPQKSRFYPTVTIYRPNRSFNWGVGGYGKMGIPQDEVGGLKINKLIKINEGEGGYGHGVTFHGDGLQDAELLEDGDEEEDDHGHGAQLHALDAHGRRGGAHNRRWGVLSCVCVQGGVCGFSPPTPPPQKVGHPGVGVRVSAGGCRPSERWGGCSGAGLRPPSCPPPLARTHGPPHCDLFFFPVFIYFIFFLISRSPHPHQQQHPWVPPSPQHLKPGGVPNQHGP